MVIDGSSLIKYEYKSVWASLEASVCFVIAVAWSAAFRTLLAGMRFWIEKQVGIMASTCSGRLVVVNNVNFFYKSEH